jgi:hypothetical protein
VVSTDWRHNRPHNATTKIHPIISSVMGGTHCSVSRCYADNKLLLVYPFDIDEAILSAAAAGLKELGGDLLGLYQAEVSLRGQLAEGYVAEEVKKPTRTHYVTIREDDKERLRPGQFLNDTLVDFWMRW